MLEAFAMTLTVVSTGIGIEATGMAREGVDYMRADEPERTASIVKVLIEDERLPLSMIKNARRGASSGKTHRCTRGFNHFGRPMFSSALFSLVIRTTV